MVVGGDGGGEWWPGPTVMPAAWAGAAQSQSPHSEPGRSQLLHTESQSSYQQTQQHTAAAAQ